MQDGDAAVGGGDDFVSGHGAFSAEGELDISLDAISPRGELDISPLQSCTWCVFRGVWDDAAGGSAGTAAVVLLKVGRASVWRMNGYEVVPAGCSPKTIAKGMKLSGP
jgi:hypothetical protein